MTLRNRLITYPRSKTSHLQVSKLKDLTKSVFCLFLSLIVHLVSRNLRRGMLPQPWISTRESILKKVKNNKAFFHRILTISADNHFFSIQNLNQSHLLFQTMMTVKSRHRNPSNLMTKFVFLDLKLKRSKDILQLR